jgi:hypothetical protein
MSGKNSILLNLTRRLRRFHRQANIPQMTTKMKWVHMILSGLTHVIFLDKGDKKD